MPKYKMTVVDGMGQPHAEIVESYSWPQPQSHNHSLPSGQYGLVTKIELHIDVSPEDTLDNGFSV